MYNQRVKHNRFVPAWRNLLNAPNNSQIAAAKETILKVEISPKEDRSTKITESEAYPARSLFSDIGGILGLYIGMSLLSIIELLEIFVRITRMIKS